MEDNHPIITSSKSDEKKKEVVDDLLEECWFFENLLNTRSRMSRCNSDPSPSSIPLSGGDSSGKKARDGGSGHRSLVRAPSLPPCLGRSTEVNKGTRKLARQKSQNITRAKKEEGVFQGKERGANSKKEMGGGQLATRGSLLRAPSLPPNIGRDCMNDQEDDDKESETRMSRLIQEAFVNSSEMVQPRQSSKGMTQCYTIPRYRPSRTRETPESRNNGIKEASHRHANSQNKIKKSFSVVKFDEVNGFKESGFKFEKQELDPNEANMLHGLQEKKREEELNGDNYKMRRNYFSEPWLGQNFATPPVPNHIVKDSSQDMKAQIKFWARAVATNVRQEC